MKILMTKKEITVGWIHLYVDYVATTDNEVVTYVGDLEDDTWKIVTDEPQFFIEDCVMGFKVTKLMDGMYEITGEAF